MQFENRDHRLGPLPGTRGTLAETPEHWRDPDAKERGEELAKFNEEMREKSKRIHGSAWADAVLKGVDEVESRGMPNPRIKHSAEALSRMSPKELMFLRSRHAISEGQRIEAESAQFMAAEERKRALREERARILRARQFLETGEIDSDEV